MGSPCPDRHCRVLFDRRVRQQTSIKKHEKTRPDKEDDRTRHMLAIERADRAGVSHLRRITGRRRVVSRDDAGAPLFDFVAPDGVRHTIWTVDRRRSRRASSAAFAQIPALYIADGHHRAASAARTRRALAGRGPGEHDRVLAVAFPDNQMQILPYNRVVKDLNGADGDQFLERASASSVTVSPSSSPTRRRARGRRRCISRASGMSRSGSRAPPDRLGSCDGARRQRPAGRGARAGARHQGRAHRQAHRLRRRHSRSTPSSSGWSTRATVAVAFSLYPGDHSAT